MARARNIKPGLFKNELLCELDPFDRLLFIGLWTLADREGRLEDRPKKIKMELFPCDDYDVNAGLSRLAEKEFIERYTLNNVGVLAVMNFLKHQNPHGTEKDSLLPDKDGYLTVNERKKGCVTGTSTKTHVNSTLNNVKQQLDNALIPSSLNPESKTHTCAAGYFLTTGQEPDPEAPTRDIAGDVAFWQPFLDQLGPRLIMAGIPIPEPPELVPILSGFRDYYTGQHLTDGQCYQKLVTWMQRNRNEQSKSNQRSDKPRGFELGDSIGEQWLAERSAEEAGGAVSGFD